MPGTRGVAASAALALVLLGWTGAGAGALPVARAVRTAPALLAEVPAAAMPSAQAPAAQAPWAQVPSAQAPSAQPPSAQVSAAQVPAAQVPSAAERFSRLVREAAGDGESLIAALVALGPAAIEPAIDALRDGSVPEGDGCTRLAPGSLVVVRKALARFDRADLVGRLRDRVAFAEGPDDRRVVIEILCNLGGAEDLELVFEAATPPDEKAGCDSRWASAVQRSLEELILRDPSALEPAARHLPVAHVDFAPALARAIASSGDPASFELLARPLGQSQALDLVVIPNLARAEGRYSSSQRARVLALVRADINSPEPMLARVAAMVCGDLGDALAAPQLCEQLASADVQLAAAAHGALKKISGMTFAPQRARWLHWLNAEEAWYRAEAEFTLQQLQSQQEEEVLQALQTLVLHPLYRETLAPKVVEVAHRTEPALRRFACTVLGRLSTPVSIPALRELARDPSPELAKAAAEALRSIESSSKVSK